MASPIELAVVELQILVREFNKRIGGIERRLGIEGEPFVPRAERVGGQALHVPLAPQAKAERHSEAPVQTYEIAAPPKAVGRVDVPSATSPAASEPELPIPTPEEIAAEIKLAQEARSTEPFPESPGVSASLPPTAYPETPQTPSEIPLQPPPSPAPPPPATKVLHFLQQHPFRPEPAADTVRLENTLGTWVTSWLAAFSIMGAVLFFLKLAMDNGFVFMSPQVRVGLALLAGVGLIAYGHWAHTRRYKALADGLAGAGIVTLLAAIFAAHIAFAHEVISYSGAFCAVPLVCAAALLLAFQQRAPILAYLAFAGLYFSPLILQDNVDRSPLLLSYLACVTAAALALGGLFRAWEALRAVGFFAGWIGLAMWITSYAVPGDGPLGLVFIGILFMMFLGDMCFRLTRAMRADPAQSPRLTAQVLYHDSIAAIFSAINCAAALTLCYFLFQQTHMSGDWICAIVLAVLMAVLSQLIKSEGFSTSGVFQSFVLLGVAACMALYGTHITAAFATLSVLFAAYAVMKNSPLARAWMFAFLVLAAFRVIAFDSLDGTLQSTRFTLDGNAFTTWMLMAWGGAILALIQAWLARPWKRPRPDGTTQLVGAAWATIACIVVSTCLVIFVDIRALPVGGPFTVASAIWIFALLALLRVRTLAEIGSALESVVSALLLLLCLKWFIFDGLLAEGLAVPLEVTPFANLFSVNALLLALAVVWLRPLRDQPEFGRRFVGWWLFVLGFLLLNFEILRMVDVLMPKAVAGVGTPSLVQNAALTALWSLTALGMIVTGFIAKSSSIRFVALGIFAVTVVKMVVVDMSNVETILRVFSMLIFGIALFVVSYLYHRLPRSRNTASDALGSR